MSLPAPHQDLRVSVVVPARDEEGWIQACLAALAAQEGVPAQEYEVLLVLDRCEDETEARARWFASEHPALNLCLLHGPGRGAGCARRIGMEEACARLFSVGRPEGLVASTDADTLVAPDWLRTQLDTAARGARAIGGRIELQRDEDLVPGVEEWRASRGREQHLDLLAARPPEGARGTEHWQFSGASLALTASAYAEVGGLEPRATLEDEYLERALERHGIPIERSLAVRVKTSSRTSGRAKRGLARDLALASWVRRNTFDHDDFDPAMLAESKGASGTTVNVILPTGGKGRGTSALLEALEPLAEAGLVDEKIVLCADAETPSSGDAKVYTDAELLPRYGPVRGYGDALWRGLAVSGGGILLFLDPAVADPQGRRALGLLGPLLLREDLHLVKGFSPMGSGGDSGVKGLSELVARPLINLYRPELAGFADPVSAEFAARRSLLASLPFPVGYGASLSLLLDAARKEGADALAQVRLPEHPATGVPLADLAEAAYATMTAAISRMDGDTLENHTPGPLFLPLPDGSPASLGQRRVAIEERPPLRSLRHTALSTNENTPPEGEIRPPTARAARS